MLPSDLLAELITLCRKEGRDFEAALCAARVYADMAEHKEFLTNTEEIAR